MSASWKPRLVKIPVPIMLAITMEQAVTKPMVRRGPGDSLKGARRRQSSLNRQSRDYRQCDVYAHESSASAGPWDGILFWRLAVAAPLRGACARPQGRGYSSFIHNSVLSEAIPGTTLKAA